MPYLFVNSAQLSVLVEQQQFLLVTGGDSHALGDQSELLLRGQQPVTRGAHVLSPAHRYEPDVQFTACTHKRRRVWAINKVTMKNINREFPLLSKHMRARKNVRVLLNTHSHRVHLQRIELEPLCTPTHTHAFAVTLCSLETQKHAHTQCAV